MAEQEEWIALSWHCPNCGNIVSGYKNTTGIVKAQCAKCDVVTIRRQKGPQHDVFDVYAPQMGGV